MPQNSYIYLGLTGEFDPDVLADAIGLIPTESLAKHSLDPVNKISRCSCLRFAQTHAITESPVVDIYGLAETVDEKLNDHDYRFAKAVSESDCCATFQIVLYFPISEIISTPALGFSKEVVRFIANIGASIDIDSYRR